MVQCMEVRVSRGITYIKKLYTRVRTQAIVFRKVTKLRAHSWPHLHALNAHSNRQATVWASCPCARVPQYCDCTPATNFICSPPPINSNNKSKSSMTRHHRVLEKSSLRPTFTVHPLPNSGYSVFYSARNVNSTVFRRVTPCGLV